MRKIQFDLNLTFDTRAFYMVFNLKQLISCKLIYLKNAFVLKPQLNCNNLNCDINDYLACVILIHLI